MKFENKLFLVNLIPFFALVIFAIFMILSLNGAFDGIFNEASDLINTNDDTVGGYAVLGGLFLGGLAGLAAMFAYILFVVLPFIAAGAILFFSGVGRLFFAGARTKTKYSFSKVFYSLSNIVNLMFVLMFSYLIIVDMNEGQIGSLLYLIPMTIFIVPIIFTFTKFLLVKYV